MSRPPDPGVVDARTFALDLQQTLRNGGDSDSWRAVVERGLTAAYAAGDIVALCDVVQAIVSILDAQGRQREAVFEIAHAIGLANGDPNALCMLHGMRATFLVSSGDVVAGLEAAATADAFASRADLPFATAKAHTHSAVARWIALDASALDAQGLGVDLLSEARAADALFLMSYRIPLLVALGERGLAHPWLRSFRLNATAAGHQYRIADANVYDAAELAVSDPRAVSLDIGVPQWSWLAKWRLAILRLWTALLYRRWEDAPGCLQVALRVRRRAGNVVLDDVGGPEMLLAASAGIGCFDEALRPPPSVHLLNLAATFAAAEAVATAGNQAQAGMWHEWFAGALPDAITTSLEWPVSRWRLQALLALRSGNEVGAKQGLEHAIDWSQKAGYPIEGALAQIQLAELLRHRYAGPERRWRELHNAGSEALRAIGVDPVPPAYVVAQIAPVGGRNGIASRLTPRETEVLKHLAEGLSYRDVALLLGVKWTTVQTLAHRCYEKLDASGRALAVAKARELGVL